MDRQLNLIQGNNQTMEKRILPRFPFSYLMFKEESKLEHAFEVSDISFTGMQIQLKLGNCTLHVGDKLSGVVQWRSLSLKITGEVKWVSDNRMGIKFVRGELFDQEIKAFLSIENIVSRMRPLHDRFFDVPLPASLKYWLRADGPVELFVWQHGDGDLSKIQIIIFDSFVEWESGKGIMSGKLVTKRDLDTPLTAEDEFLFLMDPSVDAKKISLAATIISFLSVEYFDPKDYDFLKFKIQTSN